MSEPKKYKIENLGDIIKCVDMRNADAFLKDFSDWLRMSIVLKASLKAANQSVDMLINNNGFTWIDDGKNDASIRVAAIDDEEISLTLTNKSLRETKKNTVSETALSKSPSSLK